MLVLASASPRRRELLAQAGYTFTVYPAHIPEDPLPNEDPIACVSRLAREKAEAVFRELALKGHDFTGVPIDRSSSMGWGFSRAESDQKKVGALAPEGILLEITKDGASDQRAS